MMPENTLRDMSHSPRYFICAVTTKKKAIAATLDGQEFLDALLADRKIDKKFTIEWTFVRRGEYVLEMVEQDYEG